MATDARHGSRRQFVFGAGAGLVVGGVVAAYQTLKPAAAASPATLTIDPNTIRRRGVGFRDYDPRRASGGFTLFAPLTGSGMVYLIDIQGNVTHTWKMPYPPGLYGCLRIGLRGASYCLFQRASRASRSSLAPSK